MQSWDASYRTSWGRLRGGFCLLHRISSQLPVVTGGKNRAGRVQGVDSAKWNGRAPWFQRFIAYHLSPRGRRVVRAPSCDAGHQIQAASPIFFGTSQKSIHLAQQSWGHTILDLWCEPTLHRYRLWRKSGEKTHLGCKKLVNDGRNYQTQLVSRISSINSKCLDPKHGLLCVILQHHSSQKKKRILDTTPIAIQRHRPPDAKTTKSFSSGAAGASLSSSIDSTKMPMVLSNWIAKYMYI